MPPGDFRLQVVGGVCPPLADSDGGARNGSHRARSGEWLARLPAAAAAPPDLLSASLKSKTSSRQWVGEPRAGRRGPGPLDD